MTKTFKQIIQLWRYYSSKVLVIGDNNKQIDGDKSVELKKLKNADKRRIKVKNLNKSKNDHILLLQLLKKVVHKYKLEEIGKNVVNNVKQHKVVLTNQIMDNDK